MTSTLTMINEAVRRIRGEWLAGRPDGLHPAREVPGRGLLYRFDRDGAEACATFVAPETVAG